MKLKALALAGIVSVLGASTGTAQTVFSVNAVGYINVNLAPGYNLIANQLDSGNNAVTNLIQNPFLNMEVLKFNGLTFDTLSYQNIRGNLTWVGSDGNALQMTLNPGEGAFVLNPNSTNETLTFVGEVVQGSLTNQLPTGYSIRSSIVPQTGKLNSALGMPIGLNDSVFLFDPTNRTYVDFTFQNVRGNNIWTGPAGTDVEPEVAVGEAFFLFKVSGTDWVRNFAIN